MGSKAILVVEFQVWGYRIMFKKSLAEIKFKKNYDKFILNGITGIDTFPLLTYFRNYINKKNSFDNKTELNFVLKLFYEFKKVFKSCHY